MHTLHFISHTHWDREWHEPFQVFRIRLAETIDKVLDVLAHDPDYRYFMLDGQTIVLEDYLEIESGREAELRGHIQMGRILVGPWYVLPDEFLVSGEAIIRNLQRGMRIANDFGRSMRIGYIPDPFGHISQMPQILKGFGIDIAMFRRGLADEPTELWWEGPDGTRVLTTYLRDGYDNAAWLTRDAEGFTAGVKQLTESLAPHAVTGHMLMMHGTDHMAPWDGLPRLMRYAESQMPDAHLVHSTLPEYARAVRESLSEQERANLSVARGELRNPKRHHMLPGVTSMRTWIKQRNMQAQTLLEQWAEPLAAVSTTLPRASTNSRKDLGGPQELRRELSLAWKYLLQNHPHDSICGCSVDQVHEEMKPRFDWVEQIGGNVVNRALAEIVPEIDTRGQAEQTVAIVVLNPTQGPRDDAVAVEIDLPPELETCQLVDEQGDVVPVVELASRVEEYAQVTATASQLRWTFGAAQSGSIEGQKLRDFSWKIQGEDAYLDVTVSNQGAQDPALLQKGLAQLAELIANPQCKLFHLRVHSLRKARLAFFARDLPAYGYKTFWPIPASTSQEGVEEELASRGEMEPGKPVLENEFLRVELNSQDGTLTITDKVTGAVHTGANRFVDGGDRGDLYNYCAPEQDSLVAAPAEPPRIILQDNNPVFSTLRIDSVLRVPASLAANRAARANEMVELAISTWVTLASGSRRVDFRTRVENTARDHRLRVEFPTPIRTATAYADQAFDLVARDLELPAATPEWVEQPVPTAPLQRFVMIKDEKHGAVLATRGLMEYEARPDEKGVTFALTLLRCVEWLSRPDLYCRQGDAGPEKRTPGAQELGTHEFEYSFISYAAHYFPGVEGGLPDSETPLTWNRARLQALGFATPVRAEATDAHPGLLPSVASWVDVSSPDFLLTACKPPEEGSGFIVRGYNAGEATLQVRLRPYRPFARVMRADLNEASLETLNWTGDGEVEIKAAPREIVTLRFED